MDNEYLSLQLIRNTYDVNEGESIINQLVNDKISFLKKQIFKLEERYGINSPFLENRIAELTKNKEQLESFLRNVDEDDKEMLINCSIDIQLVPIKNSDRVEQSEKNQEWI